MDYLVDDMIKPVDVSDQIFSINILMTIVFSVWVFILCKGCTNNVFVYGITVMLTIWLISIAYVAKNATEDDIWL